MRVVNKNIKFGDGYNKLYYEQFGSYDEYWRIVEMREKTNAHDSYHNLDNICNDWEWVGCKSYDEAKNCVYVKLVNLSNEKQSISVSLDEEASAHGYFIEGEPLEENSFEEPEKICIHQREVALSELELSKACVCVLEICL